MLCCERGMVMQFLEVKWRTTFASLATHNYTKQEEKLLN